MNDMNGMKEHFDCSEYPNSHPLYSANNQAVPGKFKDECAGKIISEFVGLRSKLYALPIDGEVKEKKTAKDVKTCVIDKTLTFSDYKNVLANRSQLTKDMNFIKSKHHKVSTVNVSKICLSSFDNKRYIIDDGVNSLSYGHYLIK